MATKLFVGSLMWDTSDDKLKELFSTVGEVTSAVIIKDRNNGRSKGFGFVEMAKEEDAQTAIKQLNGKQLEGRNINVSEAKPQEAKSGDTYRQAPRGNNNNRRYSV